jgi:pimeloyl-ACP methyl ester carboxylesterase
MNKRLLNFCAIALALLFLAVSVSAQEAAGKGKRALIVIPGLVGSTLENKVTGEKVWVKISKSKNDGLDLPTTPDLTANKDNLVATGILEEVKIVNFLPGVSVYQGLLKYLEKEAGYKRGDWDDPALKTAADLADTYFVFAYDWRRDNVENARLLVKRIEQIKAKIGASAENDAKELKFDVIAHSMGGLITRYAAMYGDADIPAQLRPTWAGARHFGRVVMLGTPNEGAMKSLEALNTGLSLNTIVGTYQPDYLNREVAFSFPALFQLLPHGRSARLFDENLRPLRADIYDPQTWNAFGWSALSDPKIAAKYTPAQRAQMEKYLSVALLRAKRFHEALNVKTAVPDTLRFSAVGADCKLTLDGAVVYREEKTKTWKTLFRAASFKNSAGEKIAEERVRGAVYAPGDGIVSRRSFFGETLSAQNGQSLVFPADESPFKKLVCEAHTELPGKKSAQAEILRLLLQ